LPTQYEPYPGVGKITRKALRPSREPAVRLQVLAIWAFVAFLWTITKAPAASRGLAIASVAAVAFFLYPFIEGPIRLHARGKLALHAGYRVAEESTGEGLAAAPLAAYREKDLEELGFAYAGRLISPAEQKNIGVVVEIYLHKQNRDSAQLAEIVGGLRSIPVIVFKSRFDDGFAFETNNISRASIFESDPSFPSFCFPAVRSTADLYHLHRKLKEQFLAGHCPMISDNEGELTDFIARAEMRHQRIASCGGYHLSDDRDCYVHTWKGAFWHSWLVAWPVKQIRALRLQSRSLRRAKELGMPINVKLGRVDPSTGRVRRRT
jgi:hypothetical protein